MNGCIFSPTALNRYIGVNWDSCNVCNAIHLYNKETAGTLNYWEDVCGVSSEFYINLGWVFVNLTEFYE